VRYAVSADPIVAMACHCRACQYVSGGAEANVVIVPRAAFEKSSGEERFFRSKAASGTEVWRSFCPECGTPLFAGSDQHPNVLSIKVGTFNEPGLFRRQGHIWTSEAPPWHLMESDLPKAEANPVVPPPDPGLQQSKGFEGA
jgi:hypothetical protein